MSNDRKIIAVIGATGAQGGGLVRAILEDPAGGFAVRAVTRDVNSPKAKALARLGAEVVAADIDDATSVEHVFQGVYGAFCVPSSGTTSPPRENSTRRAFSPARQSAPG